MKKHFLFLIPCYALIIYQGANNDPGWGGTCNNASWPILCGIFEIGYYTFLCVLVGCVAWFLAILRFHHETGPDTTDDYVGFWQIEKPELRCRHAFSMGMLAFVWCVIIPDSVHNFNMYAVSLVVVLIAASSVYDAIKKTEIEFRITEPAKTFRGVSHLLFFTFGTIGAFLLTQHVSRESHWHGILFCIGAIIVIVITYELRFWQWEFDTTRKRKMA